MAGEEFEWVNGGFDLHVLANSPLELATLLQVTFPGDPNPHRWSEFTGTPPPGLTVAFTTFKQLTTNPHGVTVNTQTGRVDSVATPKLRNLIVTVIIGGTDATNPSKAIRLSIRIFLHDSLTSAQLSPPTLHVPAGTDASMSLLGMFSDGPDGIVVGDITRYPVATWVVVSGPGSNDADVHVTVDPVSAIAIISVDAAPVAADLPATIRVTLPTSLGATPPTVPDGTVDIADSWTRDTLAEPVGNADTTTYQNATNVLFLPDGFVGDDGQKLFNKVVNILYGQMKDSRITRPYDLCVKSKKLNFFKAWVPSTEDGCTVLNDLSATGNGSNADVVVMPRDPATKSDPGFKKLSDLLWVVGLPTKTQAARTSYSDQLNEWVTLFGLASDLDVTNLWRKWKKLYPRYSPIERDTAFGAASGARPKLEDPSDQRGLIFNTARTSRTDIQPFLARLYLAAEQSLPLTQRIGRMWGPDNHQIILLSNGTIDDGARDDLIMMTLTTQDPLILGAPPTDGDVVELVPRPIGGTLPADIRGTVSHELGHTLHLGDEYPDFAGDIQKQDADDWNLQAAGDVDTPSDPTKHPIDASKIRWGTHWKRIQFAGLFTALPTLIETTTAGSRFSLPVRPEDKDTIKKKFLHDVPRAIRFRRRPLNNTYPAGQFESDPMSLEFDIDNDTITGLAVDANAASVAAFVQNLASSSVPLDQVIPIVPRLDKNGVEIGLMHVEVGKRMETTHSPLNRKQGDSCTFNDDSVLVPVNFLPDNFLPRNFITRVVGLYDGGGGYSCAVYHPQGLCHMRDQHAIRFVPEGIAVVDLGEDSRGRQLTEFCPVCRYILVDLLDPTLHGQIDDEYEKQYPDIPPSTP